MRLRASSSPPADHPVLERRAPRSASVGGGTVRRLVPAAGRRTIGPWCFLDSYGPGPAAGMQVDPHPHTGLQTVSWLLSGEIEHRDSLGHVQRIRPGQLNWMTAGTGIVHAEYGIPGDPVEGVQLWVALPEAHRRVAPDFTHLPELPRLRQPGGEAVVLVGELAGTASPAPRFHPIVGAELRGSVTLPLDPTFEHAVFALRGSGRVAGEPLAEHELVYLGRGRTELPVDVPIGLLLGGIPLGEPLLMWWNFVERTHHEVVAARARWEAGEMPAVPNTPGFVHAPPLEP